MLQNRLDLLFGKDYRNIFGFFRPGNVFEIPEILFEGMAEQKKKGIEGLVLGGGRNPVLNRQIGQIFFNVF
jgi:hypothetical protein